MVDRDGDFFSTLVALFAAQVVWDTKVVSAVEQQFFADSRGSPRYPREHREN